MLKELRKRKKLTQKEAAKLVSIPLRTYQNYENDYSKIGSFKYESIYKTLLEKTKIDEEHGILSLEEITHISTPILKRYNATFVIYLVHILKIKLVKIVILIY